jgi:hypothetical protein
MRALFTGDDPALKQTAMAYLARHGNASDLPLFEAHMADRQFRLYAIDGIRRFGTAETTKRIHDLMQASSPPDGQLRYLLYQLTFAYPLPDTDVAWEGWWESRRTSTRSEWATSTLRDALSHSSGQEVGNGAAALGFLADQDDQGAHAAIESAADARSSTIRIAAAYATRRWDRAKSQRLLARELRNRDYSACQRAAQLLEEPPSDVDRALGIPFDETVSIDCRDPSSRIQGIRKWSVSSRPR